MHIKSSLHFWAQNTFSKCLKIFIQTPVLEMLFKEINNDVLARIILAYFLTNRAEYKQGTSH